MENNNMTAVEWLVRKVNMSRALDSIPAELVIKAKQMEKEQMLWFFRKFHMINEESNSHYIKEFEHHYNETYGIK